MSANHQGAAAAPVSSSALTAKGAATAASEPLQSFRRDAKKRTSSARPVFGGASPSGAVDSSDSILQPPAPPPPQSRNEESGAAEKCGADRGHEGEATGAVFGARTLGEDEDEWAHNAWDHVTPPPEYLEMAKVATELQAQTRLAESEAARYHDEAASYWDRFYARHENRFFKDRRWLHVEFAPLVDCTRAEAPPTTVLEIGCGAGNTVFPLLQMNRNPALHVVACDYSAEAIAVVKAHELYRQPPCGKCTALVWDLASSPSSPSSSRTAALPAGVEPGTVDVATLIFCLSALRPDEWRDAVRNVHELLRPGGLVLLRDYGRHDLAQLRFGRGRQLDEDFYVRGDGTRVYFFEPEQLRRLFVGAGDGDGGELRGGEVDEDEGEGNCEETAARTATATAAAAFAATEAAASSAATLSPGFECVELGVDRRLLLNRKQRKKMYRVWLQASFRKRGGATPTAG